MYLKSICAFALGVCVLVPRPAAAQSSDTLRLDDVYRELRAHNPKLKAASALIDAEQAKESAAGLPPDPQLQLGVMNLSLPDFSADMPTSMAPSVQAMQMLPFPGKLSISKTIARQTTEIARINGDEAWWELRSQAAMAFYEIYQADRQIGVMQETLELLRRFQKVAQAMYSAGEGRQADVLRANVEIARMQAELTRMRTMRMVGAARLNSLLNRPAGTVVSPTAEIETVNVPGTEALVAYAEASRPMLAAARVAVEQARSRESLARREIWPDLTVGVQYGRRPTDMGTENMGSAMIGFSVPVFAKQRQLRMRDEASAMKQMADADLTETRAMVNGRISQLVAEIQRARSLITLYATDVLPQAKATVESAFSSYRVGAVDFMTLVDAQMTTNTYRQELIALEAQHGTSVAELEMTIGRELNAAALSVGR